MEGSWERVGYKVEIREEEQDNGQWSRLWKWRQFSHNLQVAGLEQGNVSGRSGLDKEQCWDSSIQDDIANS